MDERSESLDLPPALRRAFRARAETEALPAELDRAVLDEGRAILALHVRRRFVLRRLVPLALATAAAAVLFVVLVPRWLASSRVGSVESVARREDLDGNGRVDILDAFQLARELARGVHESAARDLTGDGRVDRGDVELLAQLAVRIGS